MSKQLPENVHDRQQAEDARHEAWQALRRLDYHAGYADYRNILRTLQRKAQADLLHILEERGLRVVPTSISLAMEDACSGIEAAAGDYNISIDYKAAEFWETMLNVVPSLAELLKDPRRHERF